MKAYRQWQTALMTTLVTALAVGILATPVSARDMKLGHVGTPGSVYEKTADEFTRIANSRLPEGWKIVSFGSSQLGNDVELIQKLKLGTVDFALPSSAMSTVAEQFAITELPYTIESTEHATEIQKDVFWKLLAPLAKKQGYHVLAMWESGVRHATNNIRPINKPEDLKGIKMRVAASPWRVKAFKAWGANPTPMAWSEVFVALQTRVVDGQENPIANTYSAKIHEVQKYLSLTGHIYAPMYLVGGRTWGSFPKDVRDILAAAAQEARPFNLKMSKTLENQTLEKIKAAGVKVNQPDIKAFVAATAPVHAEFAKTVPGGEEIIAAFKSVAPK